MWKEYFRQCGRHMVGRSWACLRNRKEASVVQAERTSGEPGHGGGLAGELEDCAVLLVEGGGCHQSTAWATT